MLISCAYLLGRNIYASPLPIFKKNLLIYFGLCWVFVAAHGLSLVAVSGGSLPIFKLGFLLLSLSLRSSLYGLDINPLADVWFAIFCPILWVAYLTLLIVTWCTKYFTFHEVWFAYFFLLLPVLWCHSQEKDAKSNVISFWLMFSSKSFMVLALKFRSLSYFELAFAYGVR